jgi:hypothetical protein
MKPTSVYGSGIRIENVSSGIFSVAGFDISNDHKANNGPALPLVSACNANQELRGRLEDLHYLSKKATV